MVTLTPAASTTAAVSDLSPTRLNLMRAGYLLMGVGLALVKWPLLPDARTLPLYEGVTLWLGLVALPKILDGSVDTATSEIAVTCSLVVVILAVIPWRYVWRSYVSASGDRWR